MFIARIIFHLVGRFCWLALWGLAYGLLHSLLCGAVSGTVLGFAVAPDTAGSGLKTMESVLLGSFMGPLWAVSIGLPTYVMVFGISGCVTTTRRFISDDELRKELGRAAFRGSALGTLGGMILVPCAYGLLWLALHSLTKQPPMLDWFLVYIGGVILGFIVGVVMSALWVLYDWRTPQWFRIKR